MVSSCKLYMNSQRMNVYMLIVYIIQVECDDIMLNHHLWLDVACDFTYATNGILIIHFGCNLFLVVNYNFKLRLFSNEKKEVQWGTHESIVCKSKKPTLWGLFYKHVINYVIAIELEHNP
jgi:hypothetical protein